MNGLERAKKRCALSHRVASFLLPSSSRSVDASTAPHEVDTTPSDVLFLQRRWSGDAIFVLSVSCSEELEEKLTVMKKETERLERENHQLRARQAPVRPRHLLAQVRTGAVGGCRAQERPG